MNINLKGSTAISLKSRYIVYQVERNTDNIFVSLNFRPTPLGDLPLFSLFNFFRTDLLDTVDSGQFMDTHVQWGAVNFGNSTSGFDWGSGICGNYF
jgi:hypothetical protein